MSVRQDQVQVNVEINGAKAGTTLRELETTAKQLRNELKNLPTDTAAFAAKAEELRGVNTQLKEISNTVKGVDSSLKGATGSGGLFSKVLAGAASVFTGTALLDFAKGALNGIKDFATKSIDAFNEADKGAKQLTAGLNGNVEASEKLQAQAGGLQKSLKGLFDDDDIIKAQTRLSLYTKEAGSIEELTPLILDLAAAKGVDLVTAAEAVGKSVAGTGDALKKLGITVKDAGTEQERLKLITQGLTEVVGGQAKVVAESGASGWQRFTNTMGEFMEWVGSKISPIISRLGDFLSDLFDKSEPVIAIFRGIFNVFGQVWDQVKALIASFGLFNDKSSIADTVIKGLTFVLNLLTIGLRFTGNAIREVVGFINEMVAKGSGAGAAIIAVFTEVKDFFVDIFSNVGQILKGVFTLDLDDIKAGVTGLQTTYADMGSKIRNAYEGGYKLVKDRQKAATAIEEEADHQAAVVKATTRVKQLTEAEQKALEEAKKKKDAEAKKAADLETKRLADLASKQAELTQQLEDLRISAMRDSEQKDIAQEELRFQREQAGFVKRVNELRLLGANEAQIRLENDAFDESAKEAHENKLQDITLKFNAKKIADAKKTEDEKKRIKEADYNFELGDLNAFYDALINAIRENEVLKIEAAGSPDEILAIKQTAADAEVAIELQKNIELKRLNEDYGQSTADQDKFIADERIRLAEKTAQGRVSIEQLIKQHISDGLDFAIEALGRDEAARKKNAGLIKAFTISKIVINLAEEISGIFSKANQNAINAIIPGSGNIIGAIQAGFAVGRSVLAVSKVNQQQFAGGGPTGKGFGIKDSTGHNVAGVVHANEWVSPQWMTEHPMYGRVIHHLEDARVRGFANGGFTTTPTGGLPGLGAAISEGVLLRIAEAVERFPTEVHSKIVFTEFEKVQNDANDVKNSASIG